jgi:hypothetical protein
MDNMDILENPFMLTRLFSQLCDGSLTCKTKEHKLHYYLQNCQFHHDNSRTVRPRLLNFGIKEFFSQDFLLNRPEDKKILKVLLLPIWATSNLLPIWATGNLEPWKTLKRRSDTRRGANQCNSTHYNADRMEYTNDLVPGNPELWTIATIHIRHWYNILHIRIRYCYDIFHTATNTLDTGTIRDTPVLFRVQRARGCWTCASLWFCH